MPLTGKQRQHLRALAHHLDPVVQVGHEGLTEAVLAQIREALAAHELIKVKILQECPLTRDEFATAVQEGGVGEVAQALGRIVVVWKRRPKLPKVDLSKESMTKAKRGKAGAPGKRGTPKTRLSGKGRSKGAPHLKRSKPVPGARKKKTGKRPSR